MNRHECRALLDSCSQVHLITRDFCQRLKLLVSDSDTMVSGVGKTSHEARHRVSVTLHSRFTAYSTVITCLVTAAVTDDMPKIPLRRKDFEIPDELTLADPLFTDTRPVDLSISGALFWKLLCVGQIQLRNDQPMIQKTQLGWIVAGPMELPSTQFKQKLDAICLPISNSMKK